MPPIHSILVFMAAGLALNLTPGPDMLFVAARATSDGRASGVVSALGIGAGTLVHIALVAGGLAALLLAVPAAYAIVQIAGGAYLVWLGVRVLRRGATTGAMDSLAPTPPVPVALGAVFRQGVITNVLNPKVALFFVAFLPQFVDPSRGSAAWQVIALGALFDVQGTIVNVVVALGASRAARAVTTHRRAQEWLERATGVLFIGLGLRLALARRG